MQQCDHNIFVRITPRYNLINDSPFGYQSVLFESAVEHNGTDEQEAKWLCLTRFGNILGIYCQTGLRHGSFVLGLVITATFDPATDEFVVHLPTVSSAKFWPVGLGSSTTDVVVMEQLITAD
ncbi:acyl-coenzyme A oxidase [Didymella pomorum]